MSRTEKHIGVGLRAMREAHRLGLRELAELAEVSASYLSAVERGKQTPRSHWVRAVLEALDNHTPDAA